MTENEAIGVLKNNFPKKCKIVDGRYKGGFDDVECEFGQALLLSISALEEIQQYRAIGTVDECRTTTKIRNPVAPEISSHFYICPRCKTRKNIMMKSKFCSECGQAFEWKEEP